MWIWTSCSQKIELLIWLRIILMKLNWNGCKVMEVHIQYQQKGQAESTVLEDGSKLFECMLQFIVASSQTGQEKFGSIFQ